MERTNKNQFVVIHKSSNDRVLIHHGIAGQKWGQRNGPPYPLDYRNHSYIEKIGKYQYQPDKDNLKKNKPLPNMTGKKDLDYKTVKDAYGKARYATAAKKEIQRELTKAEKKARRSKNLAKKIQAERLSEMEKSASEEVKKRQEELTDLGRQFTVLYGSRKVKKFSSESLNNMSYGKAKKYIYRHGKDVIVSGLLGGDVVGSSVIKRSRNKSEFEAYKYALIGDTANSERASRVARNQDIALKGYIGYTTYRAHKKRNNKKD